MLATRGFEVIGRPGDADQALAATTKDCPDGILLDVNLPGRDGIGWDRRAAAHAEIFGLLAGAVDHPRLAQALNWAMEFVGCLMGVAGPATGPLTANSQKRLLALLFASNSEGAARELESYLRVLRFMGRLASCPGPGVAARLGHQRGGRIIRAGRILRA